MSNEVLNPSGAPRHKLLDPDGGKEFSKPTASSRNSCDPSSKTISGGMVGASKLSELIYGKEVPSNDSSPYHSSSLNKQQGPDPSRRCCSTGHKVMTRCHGTRRGSLLEDERDEEEKRKSEEAINNKKNRGSKYCTSSSEVSVKTVIYRGGSKNIITAGVQVAKEEGVRGGGGGEVLISSPSSNGSYNLSSPRHKMLYSSPGSSSFYHHRQAFKFMNELRSSHENSSSTPKPAITNSPCGKRQHFNQQQQQEMYFTDYSTSSPSHLHPLTYHHNLHQHLYHQNNGRNLEELHNLSPTSSHRKHLYLDCIKRNDLKLNGDSYQVQRNVFGGKRGEVREKGDEEEEEEEETKVAFQDVIYRTIDNKGYSSSVRKRRNRRRRSRTWRERAKSNELWVDGPLCRENSGNKTSTSFFLKQEKPRNNLSTQDRRKILVDVEYLEKQERIQDWIQQHTKQIWSNILTITSTSSPTSDHRNRLLQNKPDSSHRNQSPEKKQVSLNGIDDVTLSASPSASISCYEREKSSSKIDGKRISSDASCQTDTKPLKDDQIKYDHKSPIHEEAIHSLSIDNCFYQKSDIIRRPIDPGHETDPGHLMSESEAEEAERDAISECFCWDDRGPSSLDEEIRSELSTEPPGMLKLEQFLKKLIEVTAPVTEDDKKLREESKGEKEGEKEIDGSSCSNFSSQVRNSLHEKSSRRDCGQLLPVTLSMLNNEVLELQKVQVGFSPQLPTSPRVNRLIATGNNGPLFPASAASLSPAHSSSKKSATLSRTSSSGRSHRQKGMQQKRNTTSTTTSGHGTTSEGESNSSGAKEPVISTSSKASSIQTVPSPVTKSKPSSSGYDSTINDDESDHRTLHQVRNNHTNQTALNVSNNESLVRLREKESKSIMKRQKKKKDAICAGIDCVSNDPKRESVSSENGTIVCCKFFC